MELTGNSECGTCLIVIVIIVLSLYIFYKVFIKPDMILFNNVTLNIWCLCSCPKREHFELESYLEFTFSSRGQNAQIYSHLALVTQGRKEATGRKRVLRLKRKAGLQSWANKGRNLSQDKNSSWDNNLQSLLRKAKTL